MAIIQRRIFYVKAGKASEVQALNNEFVQLMRSAGLTNGHRMLTDYMSGRSDRVVSEFEADSLGEIEAGMGKLMGDPQTAARLGELGQRIESLVEYAEVEHFSIVSTA